MNEKFKKLLFKKKEMEGPISEGKKSARASVLDDLMSNMDSRDGSKLGMKKVSVMADSPEALKMGLEKAKEVVDAKHPEGSEEEEKLESPEEEMQEEDPMHQDAEEETEEESEDHSDKTPEQLMEEIRKLKAELAAKA